MIFILALVGLSVLFQMFRYFSLVDHRHGGVMNHTTITGKHLGGLDPFIFGEIGRYVDVFVVVLSSFGHHEFRNG